MPTSLCSTSGNFFGRDEYIERYRSRLEHFRVSLYVGLPGVGKTTLLFRLIPLAQELGLENVVYLSMKPGEGIVSLLARVEAKLEMRVTQSSERSVDSFRRLTDVLNSKKTLLILDDFERFKAEELPALVRMLKAGEGMYRVLVASKTDLNLSAMDRAEVHIEALKPLKPATVREVAAHFGLGAQALDDLEMDAIRGGSAGHPLSLTVMASLLGDNLPDSTFMRQLTARSINSFKAIWERCWLVLSSEEQTALVELSAVAAPIEKKVAVSAFGSGIQTLLDKSLIDEVDGRLYVHWIIRQVLDLDGVQFDLRAAKLLAKHLQEESTKRCEPTGVIRAGEILAHANLADEAIEVLSEGWKSVRDFGYLQAYLKSLASIPGDEKMSARLRVLSARARMRQGSPSMLRAEMESLSGVDDPWVKSRAWAALVYIYNNMSDHKGVVLAYGELEKISPDSEVLLLAGTTAAVSMVRLERVGDAEALARRLLELLQGKKQFEREGGMHRLIARVCAQAGRLGDAVEQATAAAQVYEKAGDMYHAATAFGYIGDLHRETGEFEKAREAFAKFHDFASRWGDNNLVQIAELADAWVCIDVGDLTTAAKIVVEIEKNMGSGSSRRLKRYLAAAKALLVAGRGGHEEAAELLQPVISLWVSAGQHSIADVLRASRVRSLIACGNLVEARSVVDVALKRLDPKVQAPRVATFLRESALIRLREKDTKRAMTELSKARKLFAAGGNRREEALTLHRIAHAALDEGDVKLATRRANECLELANTIQHARAIALARELQSELHLINDEPEEAVEAGKEAMLALRRLGDDLGTLYTSVNLLRAYIVNGDLSNAIRLGPRVGAHAERVEIREVRIKAIILTGIALLKKGKIDAAKRCFREIPVGVLHPVTGALMWRLGEALAAIDDDVLMVLKRRRNWVAELKRLPEPRQNMALDLLMQLALPPRQRCAMLAGGESEIVGTEVMGWFSPEEYHLYLDIQNRRVIEGEKQFEVADDDAVELLACLVNQAPRVLPFTSAYQIIFDLTEDEDELTEKQQIRLVKSTFKTLQKAFKGSKYFKASTTATGIKLVLPKSSLAFVPIEYVIDDLTRLQKELLAMLGQLGKASLQIIQTEYDITRAAARREVGGLVDAGYVEVIRDGRGQAYRLS